MQVKEIDIDTGKIKGYGICKKKYEISFVGGPTTPTYSTTWYYHTIHLVFRYFVSFADHEDDILKLFLICTFKDPNLEEKLQIWRIFFF